MKFDYTYIVLGDFLVFEPLIIVSNFIFLVIALWAFLRLRTFRNRYADSMGRFMLFVGLSGIFGALCHSVHYQWGVKTFDNMLFCVNALSLVATFLCFKGTILHAAFNRPSPPWLFPLVRIWIAGLMVYSYIAGTFLLITVHAGLVLLYSLFVHLRGWKRRREKGSLLIVWGIVSSFTSIIVHSLHISFHDWFNHKDFAHVFMIIGMILITKGALLNSPLHVRVSERPAP